MMLLILYIDLNRISCSYLAIPLLLNLVVGIPRIFSLDNRTADYNIITADLMSFLRCHDPFLVANF